MSGDESMVGGDAAPTTATSPFGTPNPAPDATPPAAGAPSLTRGLVDTVLQLNDLLSADVRRAEKTSTIYLRADLEGDFDRLEAELDLLTDSTGKPYPTPEGGLDEVTRSPQQVATEIQQLIAEYGASAQSVRWRQLTDDDWQEFLTRHKDSDKPDQPRPAAFWNDLIAATAIAPEMTVGQVAALRKKLGSPQMITFGNDAFEVNSRSGVSIPKSSLSSHVLGRSQRGMS